MKSEEVIEELEKRYRLHKVTGHSEKQARECREAIDHIQQQDAEIASLKERLGEEEVCEKEVHQYLVVYNFSGSDGFTGSGNIEITTNIKIEGFDAYKETKRLIKEANPTFKKVVLTNYIYLGNCLKEEMKIEELP